MDSSYYTERLMLVQHEEARIPLTPEQHNYLSYASDEEREERKLNANYLFMIELQFSQLHQTRTLPLFMTPMKSLSLAGLLKGSGLYWKLRGSEENSLRVSELCSIGGLAPSREIRVPEGFYSATVFLILESFDELVDVFDVYALQTKEVGNMSTNKSRILSQGHAKLKNDLVSLKSKKSLLEHEMSKLEDRLAKAQRNQDIEGSQVVKDLRSKNARILEEVWMLRSVAASVEES
ncbi:hypothetical protein Tco_1226836 [Tanacetum coccineum]